MSVIRRFNFYQGRFGTYMMLLRDAVETSDNVVTSFYDNDVPNFFEYVITETGLVDYRGRDTVVDLLNYMCDFYRINASVKSIRYDRRGYRDLNDDSFSVLLVPNRDKALAAEAVLASEYYETSSLEELTLEPKQRRVLRTAREQHREMEAQAAQASRGFGCFGMFSSSVLPEEATGGAG